VLALDHPNCLRSPTSLPEANADYLVMDYVPRRRPEIQVGRSAPGREVPQSRRGPALAEQIADALEYLHSQDPPVVHRDIKPSNLKLTPRV